MTDMPLDPKELSRLIAEIALPASPSGSPSGAGDDEKIGHVEAQARIEQAVREIEILCDAFGYDPTEWLNYDDERVDISLRNDAAPQAPAGESGGAGQVTATAALPEEPACVKAWRSNNRVINYQAVEYIDTLRAAFTALQGENTQLRRIIERGTPISEYERRQSERAGAAEQRAEAAERELTLARAALAERTEECARVDVRMLDETAVRFYEREFYVLSNFSAFKVLWAGNLFDTSEHAYHWERFCGSGEIQAVHRDMVRASLSAHEAFRYAQKHKRDQRLNWNNEKVDAMRDILRAKADQHEYVRRKLLQTGDRQLIEDSWRDDFWGWGPNRDGQNMLGKLWMEIRAAIRSLPPPGETAKAPPAASPLASPLASPAERGEG